MNFCQVFKILAFLCTLFMMVALLVACIIGYYTTGDFYEAVADISDIYHDFINAFPHL